MSTGTVRVEDKSYEMPPKEGLSIAHFITVTDIQRSCDYYEKVFGATVLSRGDAEGAPCGLHLRGFAAALHLRAVARKLLTLPLGQGRYSREIREHPAWLSTATPS